MTIDHPLRRTLAQFCSADTMSRIVDPILADMRWEHGRATLRGCTALGNALALHTVMSLPRWCAAVWSDDDYAIPKAVGFVAIAAVLAGALLIAPPLWHGPHVKSMSVVFFAVLLVPQAFAVSLPLAISVAIPLALRRLHLNARLIRRTLLLSGMVAVMTFAVVTWAVPDANQAFRIATFRAVNGSSQVTLLRGPMETDWTTLRRQIEGLRRADASGVAAARLEYAYQLRLAIGVAAVPLGLAGLAISTFGFGRRRPLLTGIGVLSAYWVLMAFEESAAKRLITTGGLFPEYLCPWTPNLILLIAAIATLLSRRAPQPPAAPASRLA
jgi:lipopolysaccharide export LptBFGC system permease protein LptF